MPRKPAQTITPPHLSPFEQIRRTNDAGNEYWSSRELAKLLDYVNYRNFEHVITKARTACTSSGQRIDDHFVDATDMVEVGEGVKRKVALTLLSRFACYLVVQNADPAKAMVALGQTYFAIKTRQQELVKSSPSKGLHNAAHNIYNELRQVTTLRSVNTFNVVFLLLFYKRISDTSLGLNLGSMLQ